MMKRTHLPLVSVFVISVALLSGCGNKEKQDRDFHTSGSREADQRAEQPVAKTQQLRGGGENAGGGAKKPLYERLGGEQGVAAIVDDFVTRVLADPRVNWERKGVRTGGVLGVGDDSVEWKPDEANVAKLKKHLGQFFALATGGPTTYEGRDMKAVHANMKITNVEFDAAMGDLKASLDKLGVPTDEQKELLSVIESTRQQVATER